MSIHHQKGIGNVVGFVFSCPGRQEKIAGYPAAGTTGNNLALFLDFFNQFQKTKFTRKDITISNASTKVMYAANNNGLTEADRSDILRVQNLNRLAKELSKIEGVIICCGGRAALAVNAISRRLHPECKIIHIQHLGMKSLNQIKYDRSGIEIIASNKLCRSYKEIRVAGNKNTHLRLEKLAFDASKDATRLGASL
ncbi:hypothetical protein [Paenibacillus protaetiae]|uniref:Uncharacterized protein n=1 Tax=Paenibacillus protaetiae TaxID=2509456 RepID=A0A4V0YF39_9BACL|nr:hypothetical protein [Paenibacillus protaetiae]QAY66371.1 hypothetical protein ET464_08070 [Paenibacillus protaetiae]